MALVQTLAAASFFGVLSGTANFPVNVLAGNDVVVVTGQELTGALTVTAAGTGATLHTDPAVSVKIFSAINAAGGTTAVSWSFGSAIDLTLAAVERDDITAFDKEGSSAGFPVTTLTTNASAANASANSFVVAAIRLGIDNAGLVTPTTGYTDLFIDNDLAFASVGGFYKTVTAIETSSAAWTWTTSSGANGIIATFSISPSGVPLAWYRA